MSAVVLHFLSITSLVSAVGVITTTSPVSSVLCLIALFLNVASYLVLVGVHFIGLTYVIVYIGAVAVLFIFVVMLLSIRYEELQSVGAEYTRSFPLGLILSVTLLYTMVNASTTVYSHIGALSTGIFSRINAYLYQVDAVSLALPKGNIVDTLLVSYSDVEILGSGMYTYGVMWLLLLSLVLLVAMVGTIVLCLQRTAPTALIGVREFPSTPTHYIPIISYPLYSHHLRAFYPLPQQPLESSHTPTR